MLHQKYEIRKIQTNICKTHGIFSFMVAGGRWERNSV
jgi:hypothetical protein